ncbi:hypothetical protein QWZ08_20055 [Ferruginibacter paludis]|uniref:hypothetical protein n=1 Tax=Ferruginibacter paludis TaxID=1310417 RepID=UPI0025B5F8B3|nr:hypothetical protein [Ferruginibacter paludis]MDN3657958.1 hypothetical protein [Ferruginibacter paludis]
MAVKVNGDDGALHWDASISTDSFEQSVQVIINGLEGTVKKATEMAKAQDAAFTGTSKAVDNVSNSISALQTALDGFKNAKQQVIDVQTELAKLTAPGFADGKSVAEVSNLNKYIEQTKGDLKTLQNVVSDYSNQIVALSNLPVTAPAIVTKAASQSVNVTNVIAPQVIEELKKAFGEIDQPTQKFIQDLIALELKLQDLTLWQKELDAAFNQSKISQENYAQTSAFLIAGIKQVTDQTAQLTNNQKAYEASLSSGTGSIKDKKIALADLSRAYEVLTQAQRDSPEGVTMAKNIASLKTEIAGLDPGKINAVGERLQTVQSELRKLQELMVRNPNSPLFENWKKEAAELKENLLSVKTGVEQATNSTAGVEAFATGLRAIIGGFEAATGVIGLFTTDTKEYEEVTKNAASALALMNGIQEVSNVLSKTSALNVYLLGLAHKGVAINTALETAAVEVNSVAVGINTAALEAETVATVETTVATRGLAAALLANPAALIVAGIVAIAAAYFAFRNEAKELTTAQKLLNEQTKSAGDIFAKAADGAGTAAGEVARLTSEIDLAKKGFIAKNKVVDAYNTSIGKTTGLVKDINEAEAALVKNAPAYIELMFQKARVAAATALYQEQISKQIKAERFEGLADIQLSIKTGDAAADAAQAKIDKGIRDRNTARKNEGKASVDYFLNIIKDGNDAIGKIVNDKKWNFFGDTEKDSKKVSDQIKGLNELLNQQKSLLQDIENLHRGASQSGLTKEQTELDKINERYDLAIKKVTEFNNKAAEFNKKNPNNKVASVSIDSLVSDRALELQNATFRKNAEDYKKSLELQQKYFEDFEKAKLEVGEAKAKELYNAQLKGATSYLDFLKQQKADIEKAIPVGAKPNLEQALKLAAIDKEQTIEHNKAAAAAFLKQIADYKALLEAAISYNEKKAEINKKYDGLEATLQNDSNTSAALKSQKTQVLEDQRADELRAVEEDAFQHTEIYKKMNEDILALTHDRIKKEIGLAKQLLTAGTTTDNQGNTLKISDDERAKILEYINRLEEAEKATRTVFGLTAEQFKDIADKAKSIAGIFGDLANAVRSTNGGLADTLDTMSSLSNIAGSAASAIGNFASGNIIGGIASTVQAITGIFSIGAKSRESERKANAEVASFQQTVMFGELAVNELYRERARQQVLLNKLKLQGLADESKLLADQLTANANDYQKILALIQKQQFVAGEHTEKSGGFLGIGRSTKVVQDFQSLGGKSFDELEQLFMSGQLDAKAKELFTQLEKIKSEGVDIKAEIEANRIAAQEIFTGTTSDSILDSIVQGFESGKRATADFADNFQDLMKQSILNSLKYSAIQEPLKKFYADFAAASESDGILTTAEIAQLQASYNATIQAAGQQFDQLQQIAGINFNNSAAGNGNSLQGAIKGITQQQADLLAGQFGGLRITAFEQLAQAKFQLNALNIIANNTGLIVDTNALLRKFDTTGIKVR